MTSLAALLEGMGFTALNAYALMAFCLLYVPCFAAVAAIKKETGSWKWTGLMIAFQMSVAWITAFAIFQIGSFM